MRQQDNFQQYIEGKIAMNTSKLEIYNTFNLISLINACITIVCLVAYFVFNEIGYTLPLHTIANVLPVSAVELIVSILVCTYMDWK